MAGCGVRAAKVEVVWRDFRSRARAPPCPKSPASASPSPTRSEDLSLPGWVYHDPEYLPVEMARLIRPAWQIVCHASDIPDPGDWRTLELLGESVIVIRGADGRIRAFANVCRHRGSRLVDGEAGCAQAADLSLSRLDLCRRRPADRRAAQGGLSGPRPGRLGPAPGRAGATGTASCSSGSRAAGPASPR